MDVIEIFGMYESHKKLGPVAHPCSPAYHTAAPHQETRCPWSFFAGSLGHCCLYSMGFEGMQLKS